ncbi:MAG: RsmE family RNA methyltransferase [Ilumatobacter sp.]|nr:RsmE family RNA methyltransferase [Ilumatobacter sp.]MDJ0769270.1 RsmE family RNA methyltransferase [Ilumatobacter sp.]
MLVGDVATPVLDDATSHHLNRVLRLRDGEVVTITDGCGRWRTCAMSGGVIEPTGEVGCVDARAEPVTIAFAVPKHDRPEWIVQKLTELGVDRIVLLHAERSIVRWSGERAARHVDRLVRVAGEALQQSRQVWLPVVEGPIGAKEFLSSAIAADHGGRPLGRADRSIAIGPEGGWSSSELDRAAGRVGLGASVLRVETAAITVAARVLGHVQ